jgi:hypothetical protein
LWATDPQRFLHRGAAEDEEQQSGNAGRDGRRKRGDSHDSFFSGYTTRKRKNCEALPPGNSSAIVSPVPGMSVYPASGCQSGSMSESVASTV